MSLRDRSHGQRGSDEDKGPTQRELWLRQRIMDLMTGASYGEVVRALCWAITSGVDEMQRVIRKHEALEVFELATETPSTQALIAQCIRAMGTRCFVDNMHAVEAKRLIDDAWEELVTGKPGEEDGVAKDGLLPKPDKCQACGGDGWEYADKFGSAYPCRIACPACNGSGKICPPDNRPDRSP